MTPAPQPGSNPYGAPLAPVSDAVARDAGYVERSRALPASRGFAWYGEAWRLYTVSPGAWIAIWLIFFVCLAVVSILPLLGMFGHSLLSPIFLGGAMLAARSSDRSGVVPIGHLFAAFGSHAGPLALLGLLQFVALLVIFIVGGMLGSVLVFSIIGAAGIGPGASPADLLSSTWLPFVGMGVLFGILYLPIAYAVWIASALVTLHDLAALDALRMGFVATFRNLLPLIVFALAFLVLALLATLPALLGWLALGPVALCALYVQYREMFVVAA